MKNLIKKITGNKKVLLYVLTILITIYSVYLFSRLWELAISGIIIIGIFIGIIIYNLIKKVIEYKIIFTKKNIFISLILTIITILCFQNFFTSKYQTTKIEIIGKNVSIDNIDKIVLNNQKYIYSGSTFLSTYDEWHNEGKKITEKDLTIKNVNNDKLVIELNKIKYSAKIYFKDYFDYKIKEPNYNGKIKIIDNNFYYDITSIHIKDYLSVVRLFCSFIVLIILYYSLVTIFINSQHKGLIIISYFSVLIALFYFNNIILGYSTNDSYSYTAYSFGKLAKLILDKTRMPLYPLIIRIINIIFKNDFIEFVCIFQYVFWVFSIIFLYKILYMITKKERFSIFGSLLYALSPTFISWNGVILTESIALSGTIIFIYYIIKYLFSYKKNDGFKCVFVSLILTFIRPTSIIYLLGLFIFLILRLIFEKNNLKNDLKCLKKTIYAFVIILLYIMLYHNNYGIYSLNSLVIKQDFIVSVQEKYYKSSNDKQYIDNVEASIKRYPDNVWKVTEEIMNTYTLKDLKEYVNYSRKQNIKSYCKYILKLIKEHSSVNFESYSYENTNPKFLWLHNGFIRSFSIITFLHIYIISIINIIWVIIHILKNKKVLWIYLGLGVFPLIIIISSFIGTCGEFMRTAITCSQFSYISFMILIYQLSTSEVKKI